MFNIRNATLKDIPLIRDLTFRVWPQTYQHMLSQEQVDYMLDQMYSVQSLERQITMEGCRFIFVLDDGEPVGFASFGETAPHLFKLHKVYILPSQQGKGTGKFVLDYIIRTIRVEAAQSLQLQVNRHNKARLFYEKMGFVVIKEADFDIGNGFFMNDYIMECRVES